MTLERTVSGFCARKGGVSGPYPPQEDFCEAAAPWVQITLTNAVLLYPFNQPHGGRIGGGRVCCGVGFGC